MDFLRRLFMSIQSQQFKDFEVVVSDDSPDNTAKDFIQQYREFFPIKYLSNNPSLGSPANWNNAIKNATGTWIKLMHDDDWFSGPGSLGVFADAAKKDEAGFIFSSYNNIYVEEDRTEMYKMNSWEKYLLQRSPFNLLKKNFIGHPSTTLIKNDGKFLYDEQFKWVVDLEFYIRILSAGIIYKHIPEPLINIGMSSQQVTATSFRIPAVEIPENIALLEKIKPSSLKRIYAYDYYWRFIRNLGVRNKDFIDKYYKGDNVPRLLLTMIKQQSYIPASWLKFGFVSKITMLKTYFWNRLNGLFK